MPIIQTTDFRCGALPEMMEAGDDEGHRLADATGAPFTYRVPTGGAAGAGRLAGGPGFHMCDNIP
jgi:hypothetical protein